LAQPFPKRRSRDQLNTAIQKSMTGLRHFYAAYSTDAAEKLQLIASCLNRNGIRKDLKLRPYLNRRNQRSSMSEKILLSGSYLRLIALRFWRREVGLLVALENRLL